MLVVEVECVVIELRARHRRHAVVLGLHHGCEVACGAVDAVDAAVDAGGFVKQMLLAGGFINIAKTGTVVVVVVMVVPVSLLCLATNNIRRAGGQAAAQI